MRSKDFQDLKNKPGAELQKLLEVDRNKLRTLKFDLAAGKVKNISEIWKTRKNIARILTLLAAKENA